MKNLFSKKMVEDFAIVALLGLDHLIGIVTNGYFFIFIILAVNISCFL